MLCLVKVNDSGSNWMKNVQFYGQFLKNFIPYSIPFLTSCARYHTFNFRWNVPFSSIFSFFSNLIIAILHFLTIFSKEMLYPKQIFISRAEKVWKMKLTLTLIFFSFAVIVYARGQFCLFMLVCSGYKNFALNIVFP